VDCIFCAIAAGTADASIVAADDTTVAFMALHPMNPGHVLVIPRRHVVGVIDASADAFAAVMRRAQQIATAARTSDPRVEGVNVFVNDGAAAGQDVFHLHVHVLPRWTGDSAWSRPPVEATRAQLNAAATSVRRALEAEPRPAWWSSGRVEIADLADHPELVSLIGGWHWNEWGAGHPESSQAEWTAALGTRCDRDAAPFTFVAFLDGEPVGSLSVHAGAAYAGYTDRGPWLDGVLVQRRARDHGIGRALLRAAEAKARRAGISELWCHTAEAARFYERCGWTLVQPKRGFADDAVLMKVLA
jgi:diadenosine tetraphosphate (Ap4A) HIT family hydrolase/GNAT superfamily N-acetyltransferase